MPKPQWPGFVWDTRLKGGRYRYVLPDGRLGALVSRDKLVAGLRELAANSETALQKLALALARGDLTLNDAQLAGQVLLKDLYNAFSALAHGGWAQMDAAAWGRNGRILGLGTREYPVGEYASWRNFMQEIAAGKLSEAQIRDRAGLYAGKAYSRYWAENIRIARSDFAEVHWNDVGGPEECSDCEHLALIGWMPIESLATVPGAGATRCLGNCRCSLSYR